MPLTKPFAWLLVLGVLCSCAGLAFARLPMATQAAHWDPAPDTSAFEALSSATPHANQTLVTEASPASTEGVAPQEAATTTTVQPATAIAQAIGTPTAGPVLEPAPVTTVQAAPANVSQPVEASRAPDKARGLFEAMNAARLAEGLTALEWDTSLEEVSYARAANLVQNGYFDHYAPDGESAFSELAARGIRYRLAGENLARNNYVEAKTVAAAFDGLMNSTGHRANILEERFSSVGVACVREGRMWIYVTVFLN
jgi:uncharacterized protein YkwD